jgi:glycosyltransferase involved in cell wall biosynthesis
MKIAVNTRLLLKNKLEGIGWFSFETLRRICVNQPEHEFIFIFDRPFHPDFIFSDNIKAYYIAPQSRHPFLWYWWFQLSVPRILNLSKADIFLSPDGYLSLNTHLPSIAVMHDLNFEHYPNDLPFFYRKYYTHFFPKFAKKAARIATVSNFSADDIAQQYHIDRNKIDVVYNGANEAFKPISADEIKATRKQYSQGEAYFLFIGSLHPRKNIARMLQAFDLFKSTSGSKVKLMIVGTKKWWDGEMEQAYTSMHYKNDLILIGRLEADKLQQVIPSALAMLYLSYFEGFGIPIIEGMKSAVPVITSTVTSMPEVAADAALLADPFSIHSMADAMLSIAGDENLRQQLISKGLQRANDFSWDKTADLLWKCVEKTAEQCLP